MTAETPTVEQAEAEVAPLTLDQIPTDGEHYGVKVSALGEDGDMGWVAFTHDHRRAIAALRRYIREDLKSGPVREITVTGVDEWWRVVDTCGCGETCPHKPDEDDWVEHDCRHYGLPPCRDGLGWLGLKSAPNSKGAVPAIEMEADY